MYKWIVYMDDEKMVEVVAEKYCYGELTDTWQFFQGHTCVASVRVSSVIAIIMVEEVKDGSDND